MSSSDLHRWRHPERYRDCSREVFRVLQSFSPLVEMASIDEAYLDITGTEKLHGRPLLAAHQLHESIRHETRLNCSIGIAARAPWSAKVASDQAKPNGVLWVLPGSEARFLAPLDVRKIPGVGKVTEQNLAAIGIRKVGDLGLALTKSFWRSGSANGDWRWRVSRAGLMPGGWFDTDVGERVDPKSISHEHTYNVDTSDAEVLEATLLRLSEMVGRRLREHSLFARTVRLKLRYSDFSTITRARSLDHGTQIDGEIFERARTLMRENRQAGRAIRTYWA